MLPRNLPRLLQQYSSHAAVQSSSIMRAHHAPLLFTFMACFGFRPLTTLADGRNNNNHPNNHNTCARSRDDVDTDCPFYGCPLLPTDVHYNTDTVKAVLEQLRDMKRTQAVTGTVTSDGAPTLNVSVLREFGNEHSATLTLVGYKGGALTEQINQDRAFVITPFYLSKIKSTTKENKNGSSSSSSLLDNDKTERRLLGVFDGHAPLGELVSEFTRSELPVRLAQKLEALQLKEAKKDTHDDTDDEACQVNATKNILIETFVELDKRAPAEKSGGCTATVVLQQGSKVYFANAGDSRSFLVAYRPSTKQTSIVYITREDKPNLADERARVEKMGGQVYIPVRGTSRVVYHDKDSGAPTGLAMSRSIGDWEAGKLGVIPNPIVDVLDLKDVVAAQLDGTAKEAPEAYEIDGRGQVMQAQLDGDGDADTSVDDVHIFAVSATDGKWWIRYRVS
jgi:serine/threonine protein phosphatase PrpC